MPFLPDSDTDKVNTRVHQSSQSSKYIPCLYAVMPLRSPFWTNMLLLQQSDIRVGLLGANEDKTGRKVCIRDSGPLEEPEGISLDWHEKWKANAELSLSRHLSVWIYSWNNKLPWGVQFGVISNAALQVLKTVQSHCVSVASGDGFTSPPRERDWERHIHNIMALCHILTQDANGCCSMGGKIPYRNTSQDATLHGTTLRDFAIWYGRALVSRSDQALDHKIAKHKVN